MVSKYHYANKRYQPKRKHLQLLLRHPNIVAAHALSIRIRRTGIFKGQSVGNLRVTVSLDVNNGERFIDLYCPTTDYEVRARECAAVLRKYLQDDPRYVPVTEEEDNRA